MSKANYFSPKRYARVLHQATHPVVKFIWRQMSLDRMTSKELDKKSGVNHQTIRSWFRTESNSSTLVNVEAVLNAQGYSLVIIPSRWATERSITDVAALRSLLERASAIEDVVEIRATAKTISRELEKINRFSAST